MKSESIAFGVAGILFGLIVGWVIGSQQAIVRPGPAQATEQQANSSTGSSTAPPLDEAKVRAFESVADREPGNPKPRVELANLYFDSEKYTDAIKWYTEALKLAPNNVNVSTDLGIAYYYTNQPDKALQQFDQSLKIDPRHAKTLLNVGIVKAFGKQDLEGAELAWQKVIEVDPDGAEGKAAKRALDTLRSAHPAGSAARSPSN